MDIPPPELPETSLQKDMIVDNVQIANISEMIRTLRVPDPSLSKELSGLLENGRLNYIEPRIRFENHPSIIEYVTKFRNMRATLEADPLLLQKLPEIQPEYRDLIAALIQESDEKINLLSVRINSILSPWIRNENVADHFTDIIERAIRTVAHRERYGVNHGVLSSIEGAPTSVPNHLSFGRWEVNDISNFPLDIQQVIESRRLKRKNMSESVTEMFTSLSLEQKLMLLNTKSRRIQTKAPVDVQMTEELRKVVEENEQEKEEKRKRKEEEKTKREEEKRLREEERKKREEEKRYREEERKKREEEKKIRDEERKKKEQSQLRLTSLFTKPKEEKQTGIFLCDSATETPKSTLFQPFFVKEFTTMSVPNPTKKARENIEDVLKSYSTVLTQSPPLESATVRERFINELKSCGPKTTKKRGVQRKINLRNVWLGPGLSGANADFLNNRSLNSLVKMKLLHFPEDVRPAYYGTWTKSSQNVSGKTPFARDEGLIDYEHDSEAEWEPEGEGEDIQSGDEDDEDFGVDPIDPEDVSKIG
ncbi:chromatin assembly factor 1 subunit A-domain-containing protein [Phycomyces nitens]|nr:chromatin assembly factor 1 subunit A-domain-containing protein [Phycomyces nitens]